MAVLPFKPLNASEQSENYIGVGIADALITRLGSIVEIGVRPTSAVLRFDNPKQDSLVAARSLGVEAVLEGSYQLDGGRLRVTVQLVSASDGTQVWSNTFEDRFTNILAVQDRISKEVAQSLVSNLSEAEQRLLAKRPTANAEAYQSYLKGRYFWNKRTVEGLERSIEYFNKAIEIDPKFALAHVGLAESFDLLVFYNDLPPNEFFPKAKAAALNALEIDPALGEAHLPLARVRAYYEWDRAGAESAFQQAIRLNPNDATSHQWYGEYLGLLGKLDLAIEELKLAQELDPLSLAINMDFGTAFYYARQYDRAIDQYRKTLEIEPNFGVCRVFLAGAYAAKGMYEESIREHRKAIVLAGDRPILWALLGHTLAVSGQKAEAQSVLDKLQKQTERHYVAPITQALIHAGLGDKTQALDWLDKACQERDPWLLQYIGDPLYFDKLRSDSRFTSLLQRISLAQ